MSALIDEAVPVLEERPEVPVVSRKSRVRLAIELTILGLMVVASTVLIVRSAAPNDPFNHARIVMVVPQPQPEPGPMPTVTP